MLLRAGQCGFHMATTNKLCSGDRKFWSNLWRGLRVEMATEHHNIGHCAEDGGTARNMQRGWRHGLMRPDRDCAKHDLYTKKKHPDQHRNDEATLLHVKAKHLAGCREHEYSYEECADTRVQEIQ